MKIFLVHHTINDLSASYSYGLGYISSLLKENGHVANYIVLRDNKDISNFYSKIKRDLPQVIGFSAATTKFQPLKEIAKTAKEICGSFIVFGGIHSTLKPECLSENQEIDAIVRGEGEYPILELLNAFEKKQEYFNIKNFWFRDKKTGKIIENEIRPLIDNLSSLPFPDKHSLDYQKVIDELNGMNRFIFTRGCPFHCPYCSNKALSELYKNKGSYVRQVSPRKSIEQIESDLARFKFSKIFFDDDIISLNKEWFYDFFTSYKDKIRMPFYCNIRPGTLDKNMAKLLKESNAQGIVIGIEHGNEKYRKTILKRNMTNSQIENTIRLCKEYGIRDNCAQVMVGLPYETKELFLDTIRLCRRLNLNRYYTYIFHPYPATEFAQVCEKNKWVPDKESFLERRQAVINYPEFSNLEIQRCFNLFYFLIRYKMLSLKIPFLKTRHLMILYTHLKNL